MTAIEPNHCIAFASAMAAEGLGMEDLPIDDGQLHRYRVEGDKAGSRNGWYVLHGDGLPAGSFGSWKTGETHNWCAKPDKQLSNAEREANRQRIKVAKAQREAEQQQVWADTAEASQALWDKASPTVSAQHPYLVAKGVKAYDLKQLRDALLVPVRDAEGTIATLQFIQPDGKKRFKSGGKKGGCYHSLGALTDTLYLCEGYATGATIHELTGCGVVVAFDRTNLLPVGETITAKHPEKR